MEVILGIMATLWLTFVAFVPWIVVMWIYWDEIFKTNRRKNGKN
jgi:hypothetical protein